MSDDPDHIANSILIRPPREFLFRRLQAELMEHDVVANPLIVKFLESEYSENNTLGHGGPQSKSKMADYRAALSVSLLRGVITWLDENIDEGTLRDYVVGYIKNDGANETNPVLELAKEPAKRMGRLLEEMPDPPLELDVVVSILAKSEGFKESIREFAEERSNLVAEEVMGEMPSGKQAGSKGGGGCLNVIMFGFALVLIAKTLSISWLL